MKKTTKRLVQCFLVLFLIAIGGIGNCLLKASRPPMEKQKPPEAVPLARTITVHTKTISVPIQGHGTVRPLQEIQLVPQVGGKAVFVSPVLVNGGAFKKNDILLKIDPADYRIAVTLAEARVKDAQSKFVFQEQESSVSRSEWRELHPNTPAPPLVAKEPQLETAKASLTANRAELERARLNLERTRLKAPFDGRVSQKNVDIGQFVSPGQPVAALYSIDAAEIVLPMENENLLWFHVPGFTANNEKETAVKSDLITDATRVNNITCVKDGEGYRITIEGNGHIKNPKIFRVDQNRLVIDLYNVDYIKKYDTFTVGGNGLKRIRIAEHTEPQQKVRVVMDLSSVMAYKVKDGEAALIIKVTPKEHNDATRTLKQTAGTPGLSVGNPAKNIVSPEKTNLSKATVNVDIAGRPQTWEGTVVRAEGKIDERTRMINIVVRVKHPYALKPPLVPGLFATVDIEGRSIPDSVIIPRSALHQDNIVWVVDQDNRLEFRTVDVARRLHSGIVVKGGLSDGEKIVVSPIKEVTDGMKVRGISANNGGRK